jgi:hypothetical protein
MVQRLAYGQPMSADYATADFFRDEDDRTLEFEPVS